MLGWLRKTKIHFIGIGGIGMSGLAEIALAHGHEVSGSDLNDSQILKNLRDKGAQIFLDHKESNVEGAGLIVLSSAIDHKNPEVMKATDLEIPMIKRAELLAEIMRLKFGIAVAGSHGKTTTSGLLATIFHEAGLDATHVVGGVVQNLGGNARKGDGRHVIAEADESDGSFLFLSPVMAAITNIDNDHIDHYGTEEKIVDAFVEFVNRLPFYGSLALNANDKSSLEIRPRVKRPIVWYGVDLVDPEADYIAKKIEMSASGTSFDLHYQGGRIGRVKSHLIGVHNVSNVLAAISMAREAGLEWDVIQRGVLAFTGVGRRLEKVWEKEGFLVIDDYGHHPTEIKATVKALNDVDDRPVCVVFEPHRYSRTRNFWKEFQECFDGADELYISPIYAASEAPIPGIDSKELVERMQNAGKNVHFITSVGEMKGLLSARKDKEGIFLTVGAGGISKKIRELVKDL